MRCTLAVLLLSYVCSTSLPAAEPGRWPESIAAPTGLERSPGPWSDPADPARWPNRASRANGDRWLIEHHDALRSLRPRVLLLNFSNEHSREQLEQLAGQIMAALAEASRYHGYANPQAPVFLQYEVFKYVDLRDPDRQQGDSRRFPVKNPLRTSGFNTQYRKFFSEAFARHYGVPDPRDGRRLLRLDELIDGGYVHEVWFFVSGAPSKPHSGAYEVVEEKPQYDEHFARQGERWVQAGNGGDDDQPWTGRSVRIGCINASRGVGCFLESLSHGIEGMGTSGAIPYFSKYFRDYAGYNLREKFKLPFDTFYELDYGAPPLSYPDEKTLVVEFRGQRQRVENYLCAAGNAHIPPNGRGHYDLGNDRPVLSTIEDWRIGSGPGGRDLAKPFTNAAFRRYDAQAPDCMGSWLIYWRQNMPGLDNRQKDDAGKPMKNWWPFLFY